jgi:predicted dinucleotide-binding enzyme
MNIAILGSGHVGGTLGERWAKVGHNVVFGSRSPESQELRDLVKRSGETASAATLEAAVQSAGLVVVALPWPAAKTVLASLDLKNKIVFDCTNPLLPDLTGLQLGTTTSAGEQIAASAPGASVVKIFNTTGFGNMADPIYGGDSTTMFYCGGDASAKAVAQRLASELGFEPIDAGPLENARLLEPLAMLWIWLAVKGGHGVNIAFRLLHR